MNVKQLMQTIDRTYKEIQNLGIQPTKSNMLILVRTLQTLEEMYNHLKNETDELEVKNDAE